MELLKFPGHNVVIAEHQPQYRPMPAYQDPKDPSGRVTCCWRLSWPERLKLLVAGRLWHHILTFRQPLQPQLLEVDAPELPSAP